MGDDGPGGLRAAAEVFLTRFGSILTDGGAGGPVSIGRGAEVFDGVVGA